MSIAKEIRIYLTKNNISQTWLSIQTGITLTKLNMALNGKRKMSIDEYAKIVEALNIDANTFINLK